VCSSDLADALGVTAAELVDMPGQETVPVAALLNHEGARAPSQTMRLTTPQPDGSLVGVRVTAGIGDYRNGDAIWCEKMAPDGYGRALNRDILVPRPGGRFLFARLIGREDDKLHLLPLGAGTRQQVVSDPPWIAVAVRLIRSL
jgi:hypothetical protein